MVLSAYKLRNFSLIFQRLDCLSSLDFIGYWCFLGVEMLACGVPYVLLGTVSIAGSFIWLAIGAWVYIGCSFDFKVKDFFIFKAFGLDNEGSCFKFFDLRF